MIDHPQRLDATLSRSPDLEGPRRRAVVQLDAVLSFVGTVLSALGLAMLAPAGFDLADGSPEWRSFALSSVITLFVGRALVLANQGSFQRLGTREAALAAVIAWIAASLCGALPFLLMERPMSFTDAVFEAVSGLTASGSTVFIGLDQAPRGILAWRFLLVWLGGLGLISFAVLFLPFLRVGGMQLFTLDLSARPGKFLPRFGQVVAAIAVVYLALTVLCTIAFEAAGMERFDALGHAMAAIGTGGFSSHDASFGYWNSAAIEWVAVFFMALAAMPFVLYVHLLRGEVGPFLREDQVRLFLGVIVVGVLALAGWRMVESGVPPFQALREASFNLVAIITCTGFTSSEQDFSQWGAFASVVMVTAMLVGGCTGSTTGGIKMFRLYVLFQTVRSQVAAQIYPSGSFPARYNGRVIPEAVRAGAVVYFFVYLSSVAVLALALCFAGLDFLEGVSAAATALAGAGPALGPRIGPCCTYATLSDAAKWLFALGMLAGRLEILILALPFTRLFWRG